MAKTLIQSFPKERREPQGEGQILNVAECFCDTLQGENFSGIPSTFLRLQHCTLSCVWCDTTEVWMQGNPYSTEELLDLFEKDGLIDRLKEGQHLILTGGSPILQQDALIDLIERFVARYNFSPFVEVENECTRMPSNEFVELVDRWNNSPKLSNSSMKEKVRYKPEIIRYLASLNDSWFKFVVDDEEDWEEINEFFLQSGLIEKSQIVLMPEGSTREDLQKHYDAVTNLAIKHNVRVSDRLQVTFWNETVGV